MTRETQPDGSRPIAQHLHRSDAAQATRLTALQAAAGLSGLAALLLGVIYAAGGIARAGELAAAGYSVQETLPLAPIPQFLARGLAILLDPPVWVFFLPVGIFLYVIFRPRRVARAVPQPALSSTARDGPRQRREALAQIARVVRELRSVDGARHAHFRLQAQHALITSRGALAKSPDEVNVVIDEIRRLARETLRAAKVAGLDTDGSKRLARDHRKWLVGYALHWPFIRDDGALRSGAKWLQRWERRIIPLALFGTALLAPLGTAGFLLTTGGVLVYLNRARLRRTSLARRKVAVIAMLPFLVNIPSEAYLDPRPLQRVEIRLTSGELLTGDLIAGPGPTTGTWYVGEKKRHTLRAVATEDIRRTRISPVEHRQPRSVIEWIVGREILAPREATEFVRPRSAARR
jgi:hypothetical protein